MLEDKLYKQIEDLSEKGNKKADENSFDEAIQFFFQAYELLPHPKQEWETSTWLLASIGDMYFQKKDFASAKKHLYDAMNCPDAIYNPFINLRLGEALFESDEFDRSKEYLLRAFMMEGESIFANEDEKYFDLIKNEI